MGVSIIIFDRPSIEIDCGSSRIVDLEPVTARIGDGIRVLHDFCDHQRCRRRTRVGPSGGSEITVTEYCRRRTPVATLAVVATDTGKGHGSPIGVREGGAVIPDHTIDLPPRRVQQDEPVGAVEQEDVGAGRVVNGGAAVGGAVRIPTDNSVVARLDDERPLNNMVVVQLVGDWPPTQVNGLRARVLDLKPLPRESQTMDGFCMISVTTISSDGGEEHSMLSSERWQSAPDSSTIAPSRGGGAVSSAPSAADGPNKSENAAASAMRPR